jgi:hypothetical protein
VPRLPPPVSLGAEAAVPRVLSPGRPTVNTILRSWRAGPRTQVKNAAYWVTPYTRWAAAIADILEHTHKTIPSHVCRGSLPIGPIVVPSHARSCIYSTSSRTRCEAVHTQSLHGPARSICPSHRDGIQSRVGQTAGHNPRSPISTGPALQQGERHDHTLGQSRSIVSRIQRNSADL